MDAFDPVNERIDRYLRGELQGSQLEDFLKQLETDPELKKQVAFKELLVESIRDHGALQLKNFLKEKTAKKSGLIISFRSWYYAAAAVALILVCAGVIFYNLREHNVNKPELAKEESISPAPSTSGIPNSPEDNTQIKQKEEQQFTTPVLPDSLFEKQIADAGRPENDNAAPESMDPVANVITVASNIQVVPIRIGSQSGSVSMTSPLPETAGTRKGKGYDSSFNAEKAEATKQRIADATRPVKINFYHTKDAAPQMATRQADDGQTEIQVFNLPYDNPLLFTYKNHMYLKTGNKYYEVVNAGTGAQKVTPVTDQNLIKALEN